MKLALLALMMSIVSACSFPVTKPDGGPIAGQKVDASAKVLILGIKDGQEQGQEPARGSGNALVAALRKDLTAHSVAISSTDTLTLEKGLQEAEFLKFNYVLRAMIVFWEDNATAWSGNGDKLRISLELYDVKTHQLIGTAGFYRVASGLALFSASPDRLIEESSDGALSKLYGWAPNS